MAAQFVQAAAQKEPNLANQFADWAEMRVAANETNNNSAAA